MQITAAPRGRTFTLILTEGEAGVLLKVMGRVSGSPAGSPRGFCSAIYDALTTLNVRPVGEVGETALTFADGPTTKELTL